jgi:hypothetical protein
MSRGESDVHGHASDIDGDGEVEVLWPELGFTDCSVAECGREPVELCGPEPIPGAEPPRGVGVDVELLVRREGRQVVSDADIREQPDPHELRRSPHGRYPRLATDGDQSIAADRDARPVVERRFVPMPSSTGRSPMRPVRALRAGAIA